MSTSVGGQTASGAGAGAAGQEQKTRILPGHLRFNDIHL